VSRQEYRNVHHGGLGDFHHRESLRLGP
jgi:hypothetical protein